ncbi:MAG: pirin family protein [Myxococcota bacterium]
MALELIIPSRTRSLGEQTVGRVLPWTKRRAVGPFVFLDHMGPVEAAPGKRFDVPPHPHIGLSTVTYLLEGSSIHRDSLGFVQPIRAGDINWMTAGRGIVHSERSLDASGGRMHGLQLWVGLPAALEECDPAFHHYGSGVLPALEQPGLRLRLLAGEAFGLRSPVAVSSPTLFIDAALEPGASLPLPEAEERGIYVIDGALEVDGAAVAARNLAVLGAGGAEVRAVGPTRAVILGGAPLDGPRHMWWNFVSSDPERIQRAAAAWKERRFPVIPTDAEARVELPDEHVRLRT